jgi:hypothetical protein
MTSAVVGRSTAVGCNQVDAMGMVLPKDDRVDRYQRIMETSVKTVGAWDTQASELRGLSSTTVVWISSSRCRGLTRLAIWNCSCSDSVPWLNTMDGRILSNFRLKNSIQGDAQYVASDILDLNDARDFVEALKARFGTSAHSERYRTELSRLRRGTLTIEQLYLKVRSLVSKAAPGSWSALTEIYARDACLTALDDEKLKRRIMLTSPSRETLVAVYDLALRGVAVENYVTRSQSEDRGDRHLSQNGRSRHARVVGAENESEPPPMATQQVKQIMEQLKEIQAAVVGFQASTEKPTEARIDPKETLQTERPAVARTKPKRRVRYDECRNCGKTGYWARQCPLGAASAASAQEPRQNELQTKVVTVRFPLI